MSEDMFTPDVLKQLDTIFARLTRKVTLQLHLDETSLSSELNDFISQLVEASHGKLEMAAEKAGNLDADGRGIMDLDSPLPFATPMVRVLTTGDNGMLEATGIAFHGVPTGLEFNSFILGILDAGSNGQEITSEEAERIQAVHEHVDVMLLVGLTCPYCERTVAVADRIATLNPNIRCEAYDIAQYPELADKFDVEGVPCVVVNAHVEDDSERTQNVTFGERNVPQMMDLIEATISGTKVTDD